MSYKNIESYQFMIHRIALSTSFLLFPFIGFSQIDWNYQSFSEEVPSCLKLAQLELDSLTKPNGISIKLIIENEDTIPVGTTIVANGVQTVYYPNHGYSWSGTYPNYALEAQSVQGLTFGIYGLLDEVLGFRFIHPKQTIAPEEVTWPKTLKYSSSPRFSKHGFHLHTQHPLELTEQLHNPDFPNAWQDVKEYIDWLVRNRQNYWEWCLLRTVDMEKWQPHAKRMVDYSHKRGIMAGGEIRK